VFCKSVQQTQKQKQKGQIGTPQPELWLTVATTSAKAAESVSSVLFVHLLPSWMPIPKT